MPWGANHVSERSENIIFKRCRAEGPTAQPEGLCWRLTSNGMAKNVENILRSTYDYDYDDDKKYTVAENRFVRENVTLLSFLFLCTIKQRPWCIFGAMYEHHMTLSRFCGII